MCVDTSNLVLSVSVVVTLVGVVDCSLSFLGAADRRSEAAIPSRQVAGQSQCKWQHQSSFAMHGARIPIYTSSTPKHQYLPTAPAGTKTVVARAVFMSVVFVSIMNATRVANKRLNIVIFYGFLIALRWNAAGVLQLWIIICGWETPPSAAAHFQLVPASAVSSKRKQAKCPWIAIRRNTETGVCRIDYSSPELFSLQNPRGSSV